MKTDIRPNNTSRREFLKNLPRQLVNGIRSITTAMSLRDGVPSEVEAISEFGIASDTSRPRNDGRLDTGSRVARLDITRCLAWEGMSCQLCYLACHDRDRAIEMRDQKPVIISSFCDGCSMCVSAFETVNDLPAIKMVPPPVLSAEGGSRNASRHKTGGGMVLS